MFFCHKEKLVTDIIYEDELVIPCRESGNFEGALASASAKKFMKYFDNTLLPEITAFCDQMTAEEYAGGKVYYYTENALYFENIHCGFLENVENTGMYVVTNEEELTALERWFLKLLMDLCLLQHFRKKWLNCL